MNVLILAVSQWYSTQRVWDHYYYYTTRDQRESTTTSTSTALLLLLLPLLLVVERVEQQLVSPVSFSTVLVYTEHVYSDSYSSFRLKGTSISFILLVESSYSFIVINVIIILCSSISLITSMNIVFLNPVLQYILVQYQCNIIMVYSVIELYRE